MEETELSGFALPEKQANCVNMRLEYFKVIFMLAVCGAWICAKNALAQDGKIYKII